MSSGLTSLVLVTVPLMLSRVPIFSVLRSRTVETTGRLWKAMVNSRVVRADEAVFVECELT